LREKEQYDSRAIELVAEAQGQIVGLIDVECEEELGAVCSAPSRPEQAGLAGMIWHLAVHPDYRRRGIGRALLANARERVQRWQIRRFEAWTRDDGFVEAWYRSQGFQWIEAYEHVYLDSRQEIVSTIHASVPGLRPVAVFAHYLGDDDQVCAQFGRVHKCNRYDLFLDL
jgi:ribosomal protein S18 acetylase RimI-like enzyme